MNNVQSATDRAAIIKFIQSRPIATIASVNEHGAPESAPIFFFIEDDFACTFVTKVETRKYRNFLQRPSASLLVVDEQQFALAEIKGLVETVDDPHTVIKMIEKFQELVGSQKGGYRVPPLSQISAGKYVVCKLFPNIVTFRSFDPAGDGTLPVELSFNPLV